MKPYYKSKKFWFNALTILVTGATYFGYTPNQEIADTTTAGLLVIAPVINLVLTMFYSKRGIEL